MREPIDSDGKLFAGCMLIGAILAIQAFLFLLFLSANWPT